MASLTGRTLTGELTVMADVVLGCRKFRGGRYYIGTAKIAERMVFIAMNVPVHVNCIELHPLALVLAGSQSEAGSAHTCNPSLSSLESQTRSNNFDIKRQDYSLATVRTGNRGGKPNYANSSQLELELELELEVYPSPR